jgi:hypothetical protein
MPLSRAPAFALQPRRKKQHHRSDIQQGMHHPNPPRGTIRVLPIVQSTGRCAQTRQVNSLKLAQLLLLTNLRVASRPALEYAIELSSLLAARMTLMHGGRPHASFPFKAAATVSCVPATVPMLSPVFPAWCLLICDGGHLA